MNIANLKLLTIAGITATSLVCLPAMAKDNNGNGHGNGNAKGKSVYSSKDYKQNVMPSLILTLIVMRAQTLRSSVILISTVIE